MLQKYYFFYLSLLIFMTFLSSKEQNYLNANVCFLFYDILIIFYNLVTALFN